ncbi:hypothetical protein [Amycolatopsis cihanbeyliensis]|uniref:Uncharacterized protein n=1 Tax=Amycolatopsis cihanbeyliensis TaxID=1128664 RepID=A0A542DNY2_AMYCI|nr:hypothetical protein [Amycolatopsis cihanbeyliensis]TQJ04675.1 hypothetical protein FB471_4480 [Amycolatopsis cihanbeyliensis]
MSENTAADYTLDRGTGDWVHGYVYREGEKIGWYWEDPLSNGFAAFRAGNPKPIARPKTERTCILKITGGEWDGDGAV